MAKLNIDFGVPAGPNAHLGDDVYTGFLKTQASVNDVYDSYGNPDGTLKPFPQGIEATGVAPGAYVLPTLTLNVYGQVVEASGQGAVQQREVFAGPAAGPGQLPAFRLLEEPDLPLLNQGVGAAIPISLYDRAASAPEFADFGVIQRDISALRQTMGPQDRSRILVQSYYDAIPTMGGGVFEWSATSTAADDGGMVVNPNGNVAPGRWLRLVDYNGRLRVKWYGAKGDLRTPTAQVTTANGSPIITADGALFTANDVGKVLVVPGAGASGDLLYGTIISVQSALQATLSVNASTVLAASSKVLQIGTDDTAAIQACVDACMTRSAALELDVGDYFVGPIKGNGGNYVPPPPPDPGPPVVPGPGGMTSVLSFFGTGRNLFLCRLVAIPGAYDDDIKAVLTFRNVSGVTVGNFSVDANNVAETACDFEWLGSFDGTIGAAAPSCDNEFTHIWAQNATKVGLNFNQAADTTIHSVFYRGGTAAIGLEMNLGGGGIWCDNVFIGTGRFQIGCQNANISSCGFFSGIEISGPALNHIHFDGTHSYPYTPRRTLPANPFTTTNGSATVVVSWPGHGLVDGNFLELAGCVLTNGISAANLNTTPATPRAITFIDEDSFSIVAGGVALATGAAGGTTVSATGRGWSIWSSATSGNGPRALEMTACYLNTLGVAGQKHFAGRWLSGARFRGCRFGNNAGDPANPDVFFDTVHWTPAGASGTLPLFYFDGSGVSLTFPASVPGKVLVGIIGGFEGLTGESLDLFQHPGRLYLPGIAFDKPLLLGGRFVWDDATANRILRSKVTAPASATDGDVLLFRQTGTASPNTVVTPLFGAATFWDATNLRLWFAYNSGITNWTEFARRRDGSGSPIGAITATQAGSVYSDTSGSGKSWISRAANNTDWDPIPRTFTGSVAKDWGSIAVGGSLTQTVTCTGAVLGDLAQASMSIDLQGLSMTAYVSAADTVTVVLGNLTAGAVDLGNGTLNVRVMRT